MEHFTHAFGHGFDVEKDASRKSGFRPAPVHDKTGLPLMGDLRLEGFAAALRMSFCDHLLLVARDEERYPGENINQAWAITEMLVKDFGAEPHKLAWERSGKGTAKNVALMKEKITAVGREVAVITNGYHLLRAERNFRGFNPMPFFASAEELWLAEVAKGTEERARREARILERFEEDLPRRMAADIGGLADDLLGDYVPTYERGAAL